jgi:hypothetical protein
MNQVNECAYIPDWVCYRTDGNTHSLQMAAIPITLFDARSQVETL